MRFNSGPLIVIATLASAVAAPAFAAPTAHAHKADPLNAKLTARIAATEAKLTAATKAKRVTSAQAAEMRKKIAGIRTESAKFVKEQGFLSGAESASYNRNLDEIDAKLGK